MVISPLSGGPGELDSLIDLLARVGARYTDDLSTDNTHLICTYVLTFDVNTLCFSQKKKQKSTTTTKIHIKNTHQSYARGPKYEKSVEWNIPAVSPEFLKACEQNGKVMPAHLFYVIATGIPK